jgi:hypothetical protein
MYYSEICIDSVIDQSAIFLPKDKLLFAGIRTKESNFSCIRCVSHGPGEVHKATQELSASTIIVFTIKSYGHRATTWQLTYLFVSHKKTDIYVTFHKNC